MSELFEVFRAFTTATGCDAALWARAADDTSTLDVASSDGSVHKSWSPPLDHAPVRVDSPGGPVLVHPVAGPRRAWLVVGPCTRPDQPLEVFLKFLLPVVTHSLQSSLEVEHAASELAERYEEINLLYTISEILGRTVSLEAAAGLILKEISETVGARRASILVHDPERDVLQPVASLGIVPGDLPAIRVPDECSVSARVFRERRAMIVEDGANPCREEERYRRGTMLSVPIMWTPPGGGMQPLGVVNLSDRASKQPFTAGDQKLIAAIATQIGSAIQNARLVRESLTQQRLVQEMELAHDLQMRLLPRAEIVAPDAAVAARVVPAESVGGDFYNLFRLGSGRTGVMIADVSSHGYRAALIMALAMSAAAIHAQTSNDPGEVLNALLASLAEELESTEMFISAFYGVIDREKGTLRYANTGHPHAYVISSEGTMRRLSALDPPLGMVDEPPAARTVRWTRNSDLLVLFTDGVSDARDRSDVRLGEQRILDVITANRREPPPAILEQVIETVEEHTFGAVRRDDLTIVLVRS
ncbi:MAG: PP2C family protein-serine/threonine phosphatase [Gemmatimonadaceae bacterium]